MRKVDPAKAPTQTGSRYPAPYDEPCRARHNTRLGEAAGLTQFGVNLLRLAPGAWSSQRHWHALEDEFVHVLSGELVLVEGKAELMHKLGRKQLTLQLTQPLAGVPPALAVHVALATALLSGMLWYATGDADWWLTHAFPPRLLRMTALVGGGVAIYFAALGLMGFRPRQFSRQAAE